MKAMVVEKPAPIESDPLHPIDAAVPEPGQGDHPAFGVADLVVDSLLEVSDASLDELQKALAT